MSADRSQEVIREEMEREGAEYVPDPDLGARLAPNRHYEFERLDYRYALDTDHAGFTNREPWPDAVDVAVLGNSLLTGPGVGYDGQLTTLLQQRLGHPVLNLGLPGAGTEHLLRMYRTFAEPRRPKVVVAFLWVTWDILNSGEFAAWLAEGKPDSDYTHYRYTFNETHGGAAPRPRPSRIEHAWYRLKGTLDRSYVVSSAYRGMKSVLGGRLVRHTVEFPSGDTLFLSGKDQARLSKAFHVIRNPDLREVFFRPLEQLRSEAEARGSRFVIVLVPSKEEIYGGEENPAIMRSVREVRAGLESRKLPTLDLYDLFRRAGRDSPLFFRADMHLNGPGNRVVADTVADWILSASVSHDSALGARAPPPSPGSDGSAPSTAAGRTEP